MYVYIIITITIIIISIIIIIIIIIITITIIIIIIIICYDFSFLMRNHCYLLRLLLPHEVYRTRGNERSITLLRLLLLFSRISQTTVSTRWPKPMCTIPAWPSQ